MSQNRLENTATTASGAVVSLSSYFDHVCGRTLALAPTPAPAQLKGAGSAALQIFQPLQNRLPWRIHALLFGKRYSVAWNRWVPQRHSSALQQLHGFELCAPDRQPQRGWNHVLVAIFLRSKRAFDPSTTRMIPNAVLLVRAAKVVDS
jgi:hypothetical protein